MRFVVDTDVVAVALMGEEARGKEATALMSRATEVLAPSHWKAELANVAWKAVTFGGMRAEAVLSLLDAAEALHLVTVDVGELWRGAVLRAVAAKHPAYDALFVELAIRESVPLATYDRAMHRKFKGIAVPPSALL